MQEMRYDYLDGRYQTLTLLGGNSQKGTYLAKDDVTGKIVVKKYISAENAELYLRLKSVKQKNLVSIFHVATKGSEALAIMEYISGQTLEDDLKERSVFSEKETMYYMQQILEGLDEIHNQNMVHRDINPKNILISSDGVIKILDFDIGRLYKAEQNCDTDILGTVGYAAPEQFGFMQSDRRTDIFAAGVLMNWMLTGKLPQEQIYTSGVFGIVIQRCIQIDPEKRYKNVAEILLALKPMIIVQSEKLESNEIKQRFWPGFRSGKRWKKIIVSICYFVMGIYSVASVIECAVTPLSTILEMIAVFFYVWLTVFFALDIFDWMKKMPVIRKFNRTGRIVFGVVLWLCLFYIGFELEQYIRTDMLQLSIRKE